MRAQLADHAPMAARIKPRAVALRLHRYVGLLLTTFLLLAGLTGSLIAFMSSLDAALNPTLMHVTPPHAGAAMLDPFVLHDMVTAAMPGGASPGAVVLSFKEGEGVSYWADGKETFADPYTGKVLGMRTWGDLREGSTNLMTFLYRLHFSLALGEVGTTILGVIALLWTCDCFVGAYLTFPLPRQRSGASRKSWLSRWLPAWLLKTNKLFTTVFTWHRASGLWLWLVFLIFAWSAVALNLSTYVYDPIMRGVFGQQELQRLRELPPPHPPAAMSLREARAVGRRLIAEQANKQGFRVLQERHIEYLPEHGAYLYAVESSLDLSERLSRTSIIFDANSRALLQFDAPTGQHTGSTLTSWLIALHFGSVRALGLPYRIFVCVMGVVVATLSISGVWIWWKRRGTRIGSKQHEAAHAR